ncbi:hypothetical protein VPH35_051661 [Triticum aestivum]
MYTHAGPLKNIRFPYISVIEHQNYYFKFIGIWCYVLHHIITISLCSAFENYIKPNNYEHTLGINVKGEFAVLLEKNETLARICWLDSCCSIHLLSVPSIYCFHQNMLT